MFLENFSERQTAQLAHPLAQIHDARGNKACSAGQRSQGARDTPSAPAGCLQGASERLRPPHCGIQMKADAVTPGSVEAALQLAAAHALQISLPSSAVQQSHRSCQSPEITPSTSPQLEDSRKKMQLLQLLHPWKELLSRSWKEPRADAAS